MAMNIETGSALALCLGLVLGEVGFFFFFLGFLNKD